MESALPAPMSDQTAGGRRGAETALPASRWDLEKKKIQKRYFDSFTQLATEGEEIDCFCVTHYPTDPDFDNLQLPNGLICRVAVYAPYTEKQSSNSHNKISTLKALNTDIDASVSTRISDAFEHYIQDHRMLNVDVLYEAFKHLDRRLVELFQPVATGNVLRAEATTLPWTIQEQQRLEKGLLLFQHVKDPSLKWKQIGEVVKTKTAKECIVRFKQCKEHILKEAASTTLKSQETATQHKESPSSLTTKPSNVSGIRQKKQPTVSKPSLTSSYVSQSNYEIALEGLFLKEISILRVSNLRLQAICTRCRHSTEILLTLSKEDLNLDACGSGENCEKCHIKLLFHYYPQFASSADPIVGVVKAENAYILDAIQRDCSAVCSCCSSEILINSLQNGATKEAVCRQCYTRLTIRVESFVIREENDYLVDKLERERRNFQLMQLNQRNSNTKEKRKLATQDAPLKVGFPLPQNGICKHFKKSYRWLRFPCCGKVFPCVVCHDAASDHIYEWALRMICGFCSKEQPCSDKPCSCGHFTTARRSAFWEGGKGCRNPTTLSRKDKHKYKNQKKQ